MTNYISIFDLSAYFGTFVNNMHGLWTIFNTSIYDLLWVQLYNMIPESFTLVRSSIALIALFFYNFQDLTIVSLLLGGFATFFIVFTLVKFLLNLVT